MNSLRTTLVAIGLFVALTLSAQATPPRYAGVHDTPIGVSKTHLFLFRSLSDNEGSYFINATRRFLVAQDIETGKVDSIWPLDETRETFGEPGEETFQYLRAAPKIDPLDIMAKFSAKPLQVGDQTDWSTGRLAASQNFILSNEGVLDLRAEASELAISAAELRQRVEASMTPFMDFLPDDLKQVDPIVFDNEAYTKDLADCYVVGQFGNVPDYDIFRLECENGDYSVLGYTIYLTVLKPDQ